MSSWNQGARKHKTNSFSLPRPLAKHHKVFIKLSCSGYLQFPKFNTLSYIKAEVSINSVVKGGQQKQRARIRQCDKMSAYDFINI